MTPLLVAAWYGHAATVQFLLDCGSNGAAVDKKGQTLLHCACRNDHLDVIRLLLQHRVGQSQLNQLDKAGQTALHLAVLNDDVDAVKALLDAGAQSHIKDKVTTFS
jgi:ankyrin repeat protein